MRLEKTAVRTGRGPLLYLTIYIYLVREILFLIYQGNFRGKAGNFEK